MAEYADEMVERLSNPEPFHLKRRGGYKSSNAGLISELKDKLWTMIDGETIRFGDMTPSHRGNCVRMLIRRYGEDVANNSPVVQALRILGIE